MEESDFSISEYIEDMRKYADKRYLIFTNAKKSLISSLQNVSLEVRSPRTTESPDRYVDIRGSDSWRKRFTVQVFNPRSMTPKSKFEKSLYVYTYPTDSLV
jgi:hypothetical protein